MKIELRLGGSGGQGIILTGIILAEAAISMGKNAIQSQSYGPEARGGASKSEIIVSDKEIYFTKVNKPNLFLALTQDAYDKYNKEVVQGGICVLDDSIRTGTEVVGRTIYKLPIVQTATEEVGRAMVTNIVALGILSEVMTTLDTEAIKEAMLHRIPKGTEEINLRAFEAGIKLIRDLLESRYEDGKDQKKKPSRDKLFGRTGLESEVAIKSANYLAEKTALEEANHPADKDPNKLPPIYRKQTGMNYE